MKQTKSLQKLLVLVLITVMIAVTFPGQALAGQPPKNVDWSKIDPALASVMNNAGSAKIPVIVRAVPSGKAADDAADEVQKGGDKAKLKLRSAGGVSASLQAEKIASLSRNKKIQRIVYDAPMRPLGGPFAGTMEDYRGLVNAGAAWDLGYSGQGIGVAVIDSGVQLNAAGGITTSKLVGGIDLTGDDTDLTDYNEDSGGHGTHIAGIIAGWSSNWSGVAPGAKLISVRVIEPNGSARLSTVIKGIEWAVTNRAQYNIRVINLSLGARGTTSYLQDPLAAAVEAAWNAGIVVVAAAGNEGPTCGPGQVHTPGHDPFIITAGAVDPVGTGGRPDDTVAFYSSCGPTIDGFAKPDLVAPGRKIVSLQAVGSTLASLLPGSLVGTQYIRLSGSSQAAAVVSGVVALMLSKDPTLKPNEVKAILGNTALMPSTLSTLSSAAKGKGYINALKAVRENYAPYKSGVLTNQLLKLNHLLAPSLRPYLSVSQPLVFKDLTYNGGVDSRGVSWSNVTWDNIAWDNVTWDNILWDNILWDNVAWDNLLWDNVTWDNTMWDNTMWDNVTWDSAGYVDHAADPADSGLVVEPGTAVDPSLPIVTIDPEAIGDTSDLTN